MPPEGPNKSEELLKRYAKERQEQSPNLPLHPATRRLLQGEVARQFGKKSALENRGWSAWFGITRGRLAIGTALGAVVVTGVCVWWNNQRPQPLEMAKAERTGKELALPSRSSSGGANLKSEAQIALLNAPARAQLEDEAGGRTLVAPLAPAERVIRRDSKAARTGDAMAAPLTGSLAFNGPAILTTSTFSFESSFGREVDKGDNLGSLLGTAPTEWGTTSASFAKLDFDRIAPSGSVARVWYAGTATSPKDMTNRTDLALAYNLPGAGLGSVPASSPAATFALGDNERKNLPQLSDTAKLAEGSLPLARTEGETLNRSRRASLEPQAPATEPATATAQPRRALGENLAADKRQQPSAPSQSVGDLAAQASAAPSAPSEPAARYFLQPTPTAAGATKQKAPRELDRLDTEPAVLNRFVIEQQGNSVRVVDGDGSVYDGNVEEPVVTEFDTDLAETFVEKKDQLAREKPVALRSAIAPPTDGYSFRASGSNVTLRQMVVVNGRFAAGTNTSARNASTGVAGGLSGLARNTSTPTTKGTTNRANGQRPAFGGRYGLATNQPATIEGTVRIGVTNQQWFRAVRDPR